MNTEKEEKFFQIIHAGGSTATLDFLNMRLSEAIDATMNDEGLSLDSKFAVLVFITKLLSLMKQMGDKNAERIEALTRELSASHGCGACDACLANAENLKKFLASFN